MNMEIIENGSYDILAHYGVPPESMPTRGVQSMVSSRIPASLFKALRIYCAHCDVSMQETILSAIYTHVMEHARDSMENRDAQEPHEEG